VAEEILRRGTKLDRYEIREMIGHGGQGQVYRAWDNLLKRNVVIKALGQVTEEFEKRFLREAEAISSLNHNNVVGIIDYRVDKGQPYIVMEYLRGETLSQRLSRGQMHITEATDMILGVCSGVFACHRRGIIHRDIKPGNIFLSESEDYGTIVKVLDFGVALLTEQKAGDLTGAGQMVGTPRFFSPEQVRHAEVDDKTDQYAIGVLLYAALTRRPPFPKMENEALIPAILKSDYPRPREIRAEIPVGLEKVVLKAMSVEKGNRFSSVRELGIATLEYSSNDGKNLWTGHFLQVPRPLPPPVSMMHIVPTGPASSQGGIQSPPLRGGVIAAPKVIVSTSATTRVDAEKSAELAKLAAEDPTTVDPDLSEVAKAFLNEDVATPVVPNKMGVVVPLAPLDEGQMVRGPVEHQWTDTKSFAGSESLDSPTLKKASGTIENGVCIKTVKPAHKPYRYQVLLVVVLAGMVGGMLAWVWSLAKKDREPEYQARTMVVALVASDAGQDVNAKDSAVFEDTSAPKQPEGLGQTDSQINPAVERNKEPSANDNHRERKPKGRLAKKKRTQIEYTSDGSPILE